MREAALVRQIAAAIKAAYPNAWTFKVVGHPYQEGGVPDLLVCVEGLLFGFEVKLPQPGESYAHALGRATERQRQQIARIIRAGGTALVVTSPGEALRAIDQGRWEGSVRRAEQ